MTQLQLVYEDTTGAVSAIVASSGAAATPTYIAQDATYTVATDTQTVMATPCRVDGTMKVLGTLVVL